MSEALTRLNVNIPRELNDRLQHAKDRDQQLLAVIVRRALTAELDRLDQIHAAPDANSRSKSYPGTNPGASK